MRATQAARHAAGTKLRCRACGQTQTCVGGELTMICVGERGQHKATKMEPVIDCDGRERDGR